MNTSGLTARFVRSPKGTLLLAFLPLLLLGVAATGGGAALMHVLVAVAGACLGDLLPGWAARRPLRGSTSPLLSGLIVAFVLGVETPPSVTLAVAVLATASKYVLRTGRGHVFNPAALALALAVPIWGAAESWWGALPDLPWPFLLVLVILGAIVVDRVAKWPMVLVFLGVYFGLFTAVGLTEPARVAEMFRPPFVQAALFLAFFMLTDPPTSPGREGDQLWLGALAAAVSCAAQLAGAGQTYLLLGLLAANAALALQRLAQDAAFRSSRPAASSAERGDLRAVGAQDRAGDERGAVRGQEGDHPSDLARLAEAAPGELLGSGAELIFGRVAPLAGRVDPARVDEVDPDAVGGQLVRGREH